MNPYVPVARYVRAKSSPLSVNDARMAPRSWSKAASRGSAVARPSRRTALRVRTGVPSLAASTIPLLVATKPLVGADRRATVEPTDAVGPLRGHPPRAGAAVAVQLRALVRRLVSIAVARRDRRRRHRGRALPRARPARALLRRAADALGPPLEGRGEVAAVPRARDRARLLARRPLRAARAARRRRPRRLVAPARDA